MGCLDNIVGLTQKDCECFTDDRPDDYNISKSGLYLDELKGLNVTNIDTSVDCGEESVWSLMLTELKNGERKFRTDLLTSISQRFKERFNHFSGTIGLRSYNNVVSAGQLDDLVGLRLESNCIKGSCFVLYGIDAHFDATVVAMPVKIYRTGIEAPIHEFTIDTEANLRKVNTLANPIELPLSIAGVDEFNYSIVYDVPVGVKPLNTKLYTCSCSRLESEWSVWLIIDGINGPLFTTTSALDSYSTSKLTYGLNLVSEIKCKKGSIICDEGLDLDFENDEIALQIAYAIQECSGVLLLTELLTRPDSAFVALNEELTLSLIEGYTESYNDRIQYIALNVSPNNDCFTCSDQTQMVGILA